MAAAGPSRSRIRRIAFTAWVASLAVVFGIGFFGLVSLVLGWFQPVEGVAGPVTDLGYGALFGIIQTMAVLLQLHAPERRIAGVQQAALVIPALVIGSAIASDAQNVVPAPTRCKMGAQARALTGPPHHVPRLSTMAALAIAIVLTGLLAAFKTRGWRIPAWSAGTAAIVFGLASLAFPEDPGAEGRGWGGLAIAGGVLFIAVAELEGSRARRRVSRYVGARNQTSLGR